MRIDEAAWKSNAFWAEVKRELPAGVLDDDPAMQRFRGFCDNLKTCAPGDIRTLDNGQELFAQKSAACRCRACQSRWSRIRYHLTAHRTGMQAQHLAYHTHRPIIRCPGGHICPSSPHDDSLSSGMGILCPAVAEGDVIL